MAIQAKALLCADRLGEAVAIASELLEDIEGRQDIERAERIYLHVAEVFERANDEAKAREAREHARAVIDGRLAHIRDERLRDTYQQSWLVKAIRAEEAPAP